MLDDRWTVMLLLLEKYPTVILVFMTCTVFPTGQYPLGFELSLKVTDRSISVHFKTEPFENLLPLNESMLLLHSAKKKFIYSWKQNVHILWLMVLNNHLANAQLQYRMKVWTCSAHQQFNKSDEREQEISQWAQAGHIHTGTMLNIDVFMQLDPSLPYILYGCSCIETVH